MVVVGCPLYLVLGPIDSSQQLPQVLNFALLLLFISLSCLFPANFPLPPRSVPAPPAWDIRRYWFGFTRITIIPPVISTPGLNQAAECHRHRRSARSMTLSEICSGAKRRLRTGSRRRKGNGAFNPCFFFSQSDLVRVIRREAQIPSH